MQKKTTVVSTESNMRELIRHLAPVVIAACRIGSDSDCCSSSPVLLFRSVSL